MHAFPCHFTPASAQIILLLIFILHRKLFILQYALKSHVLNGALLVKHTQPLLVVYNRDLQGVIVALSLEDGVLDWAGVKTAPELRQACVADRVDGLRCCTAFKVLLKLGLVLIYHAIRVL